jgi:hypothetical protein
MIATRAETPHYQSIFFRNNYHRVLRWLILEAIIILGLIAVILYYIFFRPPTNYYVTTTSGQVIHLAAGRQ